jgi:NTP pyrophosphatase (non-canonical NTP hydrolase)
MASFFKFLERVNREAGVFRADGSYLEIKTDGNITFGKDEPTSLTMNTYQDGAATTAIYSDTVIYPALGLAGEAGEVAGKVSKVLRDNDGEVPEEVRKDLKKELGDVLWFIAAMARDLGYTLEEIGQENLDKLASRKARGVLGGSGDNR